MASYIQNTQLLHRLLTDCGVKKFVSLMNASPVAELGSGAAGVFYVSRQFSGSGAAVLTAAGISSTNPEWTKQYQAAQMGNPVLTYPDPYAARVAAQQAIANGKIEKALVICREGQQWTVGSDNPLNNGGVDGNVNIATVADIGLNVTDAANVEVGTICLHHIAVFFERGSGIRFINKTYPVRLVHHRDAGLGNLPFDSGVTGEGEFIQLYGEGQGYSAVFVWIDNPNAVFAFQCRSAKLQQWNNFTFANQQDIHLEIDSLYTTDSNTFVYGNTRAPQNGRFSAIHIKVKNVWWGKGQVPGIGSESNDDWYFLIPCVNIYPMKVVLEIDNLDMVTQQANASLLFLHSMNNSSVTPPPGGTFIMKEHQLYFTIKNLRERGRPGVTSYGILLSLQGYSYNPGTGVISFDSGNNYIDIHIVNADVVSRLGSQYGPPFYGLNSYITLRLDNFYRRTGLAANAYLYRTGNVTNPSNTSTIITLSGNIVLEDGYIYQGIDSFNTLVFSGCFKVRNGNFTAFQLLGNEKVVFRNCIAIGAPGSTLIVDAPIAKNVLVNGLVANLPAGANITVQGAAPVIDPNILSYFS
jgi:hypothetical protein